MPVAAEACLHDQLPAAVRPVLGDDLQAHCRWTDAAAELVAVGIAQIGEVHLAEPASRDAGRILDRRAAIGDAGGVPGIDLFGARGHEADGRAVAVAARLAVDRLTDAERPVLVIHQSALPKSWPGLPKRAHRRVVEFLRPLAVAPTEHHVAEHVSPP